MRDVMSFALSRWFAPTILIVLAPANLSAQANSEPSAKNGEVCADCHADIVTSYVKTAMAHASGPASQDPITGSFVHVMSGVSYRIYIESGKLWLSINRTSGAKLEEKRELQYYIGSGRLKGRTYLFNVDGYLFESPVNWYAQQHLWDMTPNYHSAREAPLNLPAFPECLNCHSSGIQPPEAGTANRYPTPPFAHGGITCERCHGPASTHATTTEPMLQLGQLPPARRDAICMQCHLEGDVAIERPHKHAYEFKPGDDLSDYVRYFVLAGKQGTRAVSQFEALAQSACKRASGDKMTCTSCHDPHESPAAQDRANYFRAKCLRCHGTAFAASHHPENPDCVGCHMPALSAKDISHTQSVDHRILRRPESPAPNANSNTSKLEPFPATKQTENDVRDLALAYETLVERGEASAAPDAARLLELANKQDATDAPVLSALGYIAQQQGDKQKAQEYYEHALQADPDTEEAATNLGVAEAAQGHLRRAVSLWQNVFQRAPWRSSVGIDIALGYCAAERFDHAKEYVERVLQFNPDFAAARSLRDQLSENPPRCSVKP